MKYEKLCGLSACTENVAYSLHMPEEIQDILLRITIGAMCMSVWSSTINVRLQT